MLSTLRFLQNKYGRLCLNTYWRKLCVVKFDCRERLYLRHEVVRVEEGLEVEAVLAGAAHHQVAELLQLLRAQLLRLVVMPVRVLLQISNVKYWIITTRWIWMPWLASYLF